MWRPTATADAGLDEADLPFGLLPLGSPTPRVDAMLAEERAAAARAALLLGTSPRGASALGGGAAGLLGGGSLGGAQWQQLLGIHTPGGQHVPPSGQMTTAAADALERLGSRLLTYSASRRASEEQRAQRATKPGLESAVAQDTRRHVRALRLTASASLPAL